jgi:hypothetical protein
MDHLSAKSELTDKKSPRVSFNMLLIEGFAMLAVAGVLVQVI